MRRLLFVPALALLLLPACDLLGEDETAGFALRYEVTGGFAACQVSYTDEDGRPVLVQTDLPFEATVDAVPAGEAPFVAQLAASCDAGDDGSAGVRARIFVSGLPTTSEEAEGRSVAVTTSIAVYADGRIQER